MKTCDKAPIETVHKIRLSGHSDRCPYNQEEAENHSLCLAEAHQTTPSSSSIPQGMYRDFSIGTPTFEM